jgi:predicted Zn finger-like uncharacterized protein
MAIRTICPSCRTVYNLADQLAGKTVRCKQCQAAIVVRAAKGSAEEDKIQARPQTSKRPLVRDDEEQERPRRRSRDDDRDSRPKRRSNHGLVIGLIACGVGLILMLAGGIFIVVLWVSSQSGTPSANVVVDADEPPGGDAVTKALHQLKSPQLHKRHEGLRKLKDTLPDERRGEVIKALEPLLNDSDHFTRQWAIEALGVWGNKDAVPLLLNAMKDKDTRGEAMKALGRLKDERAAEPIAACLEDFFDRHEAEEALKSLGPMAEKAVLARLSHHDWQVRISVCDILGAIGTKQSIPPLEKVVDAGKDRFAGQNHIVSRKAEEAIKAIKARQ